MQSHRVLREIEIDRTPRVIQLEGIFDLDVKTVSKREWTVSWELPETWNIGLIVGPSGSGKTAIIEDLFQDSIVNEFAWDDNKSVIDGFPADVSIKEITGLLSSVGFSSPPSWLRPYRALSNGEQFRVTIARALSERRDITVIDEFTSVVDRTVAKVGSAAVAKAVRRQNQKLIAVSCHYDIREWLEPDWIYEPHTGEFSAVRLRRPKIKLDVRKSDRTMWKLFRNHHYLNTEIHLAAQCFCAYYDGEPVAFAASIHQPHHTTKMMKREHRIVCLPDFQGVGIGNALSAFVGGYWKAKGFKYFSSTSHPAMITARNNSKDWRMIRKPGFSSRLGKSTTEVSLAKTTATTRYISSFQYVGKARIVND